MTAREKHDNHVLAIYPMMIQALYNAKITLSVANARNSKSLDYGHSFRKTFDDIKVVLDALSSVGLCRRYAKRKNDEGMIELSHFSDESVQGMVEMFRQDADEHDKVVEDLKRSSANEKDSLMSAIKKRDVKLSAAEKELNGLKIQLNRMTVEAEKAHKGMQSVVSALNGILQYPHTADEMRFEIMSVLSSVVSAIDKNTKK